MALIHCPFCGGYISDKAPVCPHCGYVMADGDVSSSTQESPKPPAPPVESGQPDATGPMPPEEPNPHKGHGMVWAIVIILVLLAAGGAAYYINAENKAEEEAADRAEQARLDSIAAVEQAVRDEARLDSILQVREDSIAKEAIKKQLTISTFVSPWRVEGYDAKEGTVFNKKDDSKIKAFLVKLGFKQTASSTEYIEGVCGDENYYPVDVYTFEREAFGYYVNVERKSEGTIVITFSTSEATQAFVENALKLGYHKQDGNYVDVNTNYIYWEGSEFTVQGNKIILSFRIEC